MRQHNSPLSSSRSASRSNSGTNRYSLNRYPCVREEATDERTLHHVRCTSNHTGLWSDTAPLLTRSSMPHIPVSRSSKVLAATIRS